MDKSGTNKAAIDGINDDRDAPIEARQIKYLNNIIDQDHCAIKYVTKPMLNFKFFRSARNVLTGVELMHMFSKGQMAEENQMSFTEQLYVRAGQIRPV
jgi:transposase-like protein